MNYFIIHNINMYEKIYKSINIFEKSVLNIKINIKVVI